MHHIGTTSDSLHTGKNIHHASTGAFPLPQPISTALGFRMIITTNSLIKDIICPSVAQGLQKRRFQDSSYLFQETEETENNESDTYKAVLQINVSFCCDVYEISRVTNIYLFHNCNHRIPIFIALKCYPCSF